MAGNKKDEDLITLYRSAKADGRFKLMMDNYAVFPKAIRKAEMKIRYMIQAEREYMRSKARGDLGVRVDGSGHSDLTADEAISNSILDEAITTGVITRGLLKGLDKAKEYEADIRTLGIMRMDYELLKEIVENLEEKDSLIIRKNLEEGLLFKEIADEQGRSYEAIKKRIEKIRAEIYEEVIDCLKMNCRGGRK